MDYYEVIQDNKYIRRVRITDGVILNIYKFKSDGYIYNINYRKQKKIYEDFYELKEDYERCDNVYPKGSIIYKNKIVKELIKDKKDYYYELKTTSNMFGGDFVEFESLINRVRWNIINCDNKSDVWED